jgi:DNA polymerase-3 subunit gamma/tau
MIHAQRIRRLATRVAQSRRPKRLDAATRLARDGVAPPSPADRPSALPAVSPAAPEAAAPALPLSEQATRWLIGGEAPGDLIPLLGDPTLPGATPEHRELTADPSEPAGDPGNGRRPASAGNRQVLARIIEGGPPTSMGPSNAVRSAAPSEQAELGEEGLTGRPGASAIVHEIPGAHRETPPLLRLARSPQQPSAQELAHRSGGELSEDGIGTSTVTFRAPAAPAGPAGPAAPAAPAAPSARRPAALPTQSAGACDAGQVSDASATQSDLDIDELYEGFLQRLRRDLIHDRERLGDLLGPQR